LRPLYPDEFRHIPLPLFAVSGMMGAAEGELQMAAPRARLHHVRPGNMPMRLLIAILIPFFLFFTIGRPVAGIICLILQITLVGWIPAALWAVYALSQYDTDKKIEAAGIDQ
jgi:hypothetical protein